MTPSDLKAWRLARGLTQQQAGELVGFKPGRSAPGIPPRQAGASWGRIESGRAKPSDTVVKLIRCLSERNPDADLP